MKRLPGVVFSAVILVLISLLQLLLALGIGLTGIMASRHSLNGLQQDTASATATPAWMPVFMLVLCGFFVALAIWGILTAVGLFRVRRWARYSILIIGGGLALLGLVSMLTMLAMLAVPMPVPTSVDPSQAQHLQAMIKVIFGVVALFYGLMCAIGVSWLVYFNRRKVRDVFQSAPGAMEEAARPILISVVAVLSIIGACMCLLTAFLPLPGAFVGVILHGWAKATIYFGYAVLLGASGIGLWRLQEWGRRMALAVQALGLVQYVVYLARPSLMTRYTDALNKAMGIAQPQTTMPIQNVIAGVTFGLGILFLIAIVAILHHYRGRFVRPVPPSQAVSTEVL